jgi:pyrroline-5-carboxylate reductase
MGEALLAGLLDAGHEPEALAVAEVDPDRRRALEERYPGVRVAPNPAWVVGEVDLVVLAVKPGDAPSVLETAVPTLDAHAVLLSIVAGVTLEALEALVPDHAVVRAMPNTPALVRRGAAAIAGGTRATDANLALAEEVLDAVGVVVRVPESLLDAVTGLSGSGPAYVFLVAEALVEAGVLNGLPRDVATTLVHQTILGAGAMLVDGDEGGGALRAAVTSPGGTTAAGLRVLEARSVRAALLDAVTAATERSAQLGGS